MKNKDGKKVKVIYVDSGETIYDMEGVKRQNAFLPEKATREAKSDEKKERAGLSGKEKRAAIRAAFQVYGPILLGVLLCFTLAAVGMYFWLQ